MLTNDNDNDWLWFTKGETVKMKDKVSLYHLDSQRLVYGQTSATRLTKDEKALIVA